MTLPASDPASFNDPFEVRPAFDQNRDFVASRMSREEIVEGQSRAAAFVPRKNNGFKF
jgi:hypothetical protein